MPTDESLPRLSFRITLRNNKIWLSELAGIAIVSLILLGLSIFSAFVLINEAAIRNNSSKISDMKKERIVFSDTLARWRDKELIHATLSEFAKGRVSRQSINMLVKLVYDNSRAYGYDPLLMLAVIHVESVFEPEAQGQYRSGEYSGALGLMQLKFETAQEVAADLGITLESMEDVLIPEINVTLGAAYLTRLIAKFKSLKLGILAYNQGPGVIQDYLRGNRPLSATYYNKVLKSYYALKEMRSKTRAADKDGAGIM